MKNIVVAAIIFFSIVSANIFAQYQYVGTYSGSQTAGFVNGSVSNARYNYPYGVTFDGNNTIYVADGLNNVIRKIDITAGTVSTFAGTGAVGFLDGTATEAKFNVPTGVFYKNGFVYVSDNINNAIRKIDASTGFVTTVAGTGATGLINGPALSATFYEPKSLVVDDSGIIYVADYENHVIRKISNGIVSTFAGTGVAGYLDSTYAASKFWRPRDLTIDEFGAIYVTDLMNNRIRKIFGNQVKTFAGSGTAATNDGNGVAASFNIPTGIEYKNGFLYVTDGVGNKVRKISMARDVTTLAGSGMTGYLNGNALAAKFDLIQDLTIDNNDQIYIGDRNNNTIRIVASTSNLFAGYVYNDEAGNCIKNTGDAGFSNWIIKAMPGEYYASTDSTGYYSLPLPAGTYTISQIIPNAFFWDTICPANYTHVATASSVTYLNNLNFALNARVNCAMLSVDVASAALRRCVTNTYYARYANIGNDTAFNAYIDIEVDSLMTMSSSSIPLFAQNGRTYTFHIGDLLPGQSGIFYFYIDLACDATMGSTWCVKATMGPQGDCTEAIDSTWDRSSVRVNGVCADSSACFTIRNTGDLGGGDMAGPSNYRIYENGILVYAGTFQLLGNADTTICWPGNGNTIQLQADQRPGHPGHSRPNDFVEDCGTPSGSSPVFGFATATTPDDADEFVEVECLEVIGSYDPNDKTVIPAGIGDDNFITENDNELEYRIRFQNTGNDTAFNIFIIDTLTSFLDPTTIVSGVSSHPYTFKLLGNGVIKWTFANILLPDSTTNEPGSHGFVKFKIKQKPGNLPGTRIENKVGIYFDFNEPVITNTAFNTIWQEQVITIKNGESKTKDGMNVYPNPSNGFVSFESSILSDWTIKITDMLGKQILTKDVKNQKHTSIDLTKQSKGVYFYQAYSDGKKIGSGKIVIQ